MGKLLNKYFFFNYSTKSSKKIATDTTYPI